MADLTLKLEFRKSVSGQQNTPEQEAFSLFEKEKQHFIVALSLQNFLVFLEEKKERARSVVSPVHFSYTEYFIYGSPASGLQTIWEIQEKPIPPTRTLIWESGSARRGELSDNRPETEHVQVHIFPLPPKKWSFFSVCSTGAWCTPRQRTGAPHDTLSHLLVHTGARWVCGIQQTHGWQSFIR